MQNIPDTDDKQLHVDRRPRGFKTFAARHMGITYNSLRRYLSGEWRKPYDWDIRFQAAKDAFEEHLRTKGDWRDNHPRKRATPSPKADALG